jgi:hypothetical protein
MLSKRQKIMFVFNRHILSCPASGWVDAKAVLWIADSNQKL